MKTFWQFSKNLNKNWLENSEKFLQISEQNPLKNTLEKNVSERGFYLYEWISETELRESIHADYLALMIHATKPLFWTTIVAGFVGFFAKSYLGATLAIAGVVGIFYIFAFLYLIFLTLKKGKLFTHFANIPITDSHIVAGGHILTHSDRENREQIFKKTEEIFSEKFLGKSLLPEKIAEQKTTMKNSISEIFESSKNIFEYLGKMDSKNNPIGIVVIIFTLVGAIFGSMMGITYFLGLPVVFFLARIFSRIFKKILLLKNREEYTIQSGFEKIDENSEKLKNEKEKIILSLTEAKNNNWQENLSGKIATYFETLNIHTKNAIDESVALRKILQNSEKYEKIFNFSKYDSWIKNEILTPIDELLDLIEKYIFTLSETISALEKQISETAEPSHRTPLEVQKIRLEAKKWEFLQMKNLLENYKSKLQK